MKKEKPAPKPPEVEETSCLNIVSGFKPDETVVFTAHGFEKPKEK